jgi:proteasome component ECM29
MLIQEEPETRMAVQEALSTMLPAFKHLSSSNAAILEALLATSLESQQHLLRLIAVQYAGGIFQPTHVTSRYLLLLATGDTYVHHHHSFVIYKVNLL